MEIHGCTLFPEPAEVFQKQVEEHRAVLLPFMVMPLDLIIPGSKLRVPWVVPHEPYEGIVGQETEGYHTFFSRDNWIGFHLFKGRLRFDGDLSFFMKHQFDHLSFGQRSFNDYEGKAEECEERHQKVEQRYQDARKRYRKGPIALMEAHHVQDNGFRGVGIFDQLGGKAPGGNWASRQKKPHFASDAPHPTPIDEQGRKLIHLGTVRPRINHAARILGFITQDLKHVAFTFDF